MRLKLYRAATVVAAMAQVRGELGPDALILSTRRTGSGVEVTAALERAERPSADLVLPAVPDPGQCGVRAGALRWHGVPDELAAGLGQRDLAAALAVRLRFSALGLGPGDRPLLLAGPPGAGKTLTAARLATRLVLSGQTPLVISADGERAGAAEQLAAFTRLLGLTLLVATDGLTLSRALARRPVGAPVLIDTGGIDPFSPAGQAAVAGLAGAAGACTALVLPAGIDAHESGDTAAAFAAAGATVLVATRLDLARRIGGVLTAAAAGLALTEAGIGPGAADGLVPLTPELLAGRLSAPMKRAA